MTCDVVYLTGASGFIGQMIVKQIESNSSISKVYCPVRAKKGESGQERFNDLFEGLSKKASFIDPSKELPSDVTLVILNAYAVKFYNPVDEILRDNVEPMLKILDQCQAAGERIRGISVVSTAYVQPPLPFQRDALNRIDFVLAKQMTPSMLYSDLVKGAMSWSQALEKYNDHLSEHHKINCYAFSKHIMESVIHEKYPSLPICVVRPSIVAPSLCGTHGHGTRTGFPLFMEIARNPVLLFPRNEGKLNIVFVEDVARDIIRGATDLAAPAKLTEQGAPFHPILSATSSSDLASIELFKFGAPYIPRFYVRNDQMRTLLRRMEVFAVRVLQGKRHAGLVQLMYENFDPIMKNNWDFEQTYPPTGHRVKECATQFYQRKLDADESKKESKSPIFTDTVVILLLLFGGTGLLLLNNDRLLSPIMQTVLFFVLLRLCVLGMMQSLFYGNTPLRQSIESTLYTKEHDKDQHGREELTWPSVLLSGLEMYIVFQLGLLPDPRTMTAISRRGIVIMLLTHALPVELIYYWAHRIMHSNPSLYRIHKHHHLSVVATPKTSVTFLWSEHLFYDLLFALPVLVPAYLGEASLVITLFYVPLFDLINSLGHTNLELFPKWYMDSPLYYFFYCTTFHHVHHKYFKYNYALFMPIYDMIFGTYSKTMTEKDFFAAHKRRSVYENKTQAFLGLTQEISSTGAEITNCVPMAKSKALDSTTSTVNNSSSCVHEFIISHGLPGYLLPPDGGMKWSQKLDGNGRVILDVTLSRTYQRKIEIWSVLWKRRIRAIFENGKVVELKGVSASAHIFKGVQIRVAGIGQNLKNGGLDFLADPPFFIPKFVVNLCRSHFTDKHAY